MTKSILITGGYGYIGSHIAVEVLNAGYDVVIIDNLSNSKPSVGKGIDAITAKSHLFMEGDILDKDFLSDVLENHTIDMVVHCAALKAVGESCATPYEYYETNVLGTANVLEAMKHAGLQKIIFSTSTTVYDISRCSAPFDESYPTGGTSSPYGTTKVINESMMRDYAMHQGFEVLSLRYFNPIGAHQSGSIGEDPAQPPTTLLPIILQTLTGHRESMVVYGNDYDTPDGTCLRDYIHVCDVATAHVDGIHRLLHNKNAIFEPINIGTGTPTSVLELINAVEECTGMDVPWSYTDRRPGDVTTAYATTDHAKNSLGWEAKFTIPEAVKDAWKYRRSHFANN